MTINDDRGAHLPHAQEFDTAYPSSARQYSSAPPATGKLAEQAISDVLGWRWREGDTKGFVAALTGSFKLSEVQGRTEAMWTPRGYAIQADLGAVTGGQASLAARARSAAKDALALLDSLRPLRTNSDPENAEGFRALVRHDLEQIRQELESPLIRVPRVDQFFLLLLGQAAVAGGPGDTDADRVGGHLGRLRDEFGLLSGQVNTIEEERVQTSFITLTDWVVSLFRGWRDSRNRIDPFSQPATGQPFFGPAVVALSQLLSATAAQVDEVVAMLQSVFVQQEDLEVLRIPIPDNEGGGTMSLGGLLRWVRDFASVEGGQLIESAGREGVGTAFVQVATTLLRIVANLPRRCPDDGYHATLPPGFFTSRVQRAIDELDDDLREVVRIATPIGNPGPPSAPPPGPVVTPPPVPSVAELREGNAAEAAESSEPAEPAEPSEAETPKTRAPRKRTGQ